MALRGPRASFRAQPVQCLLLGLSSLLLGMYFGGGVEPEMSAIALQTGIVGLFAFTGFACRSSTHERHYQAAGSSGQIPARTAVEQRLQRMVVPPPHRVGQEVRVNRPMSAKIVGRTGDTVLISVE